MKTMTTTIVTTLMMLALGGVSQAGPKSVSEVSLTGQLRGSTFWPQGDQATRAYRLNRTQSRQLSGLAGQPIRVDGVVLAGVRTETIGTRTVSVVRLKVRSVFLEVGSATAGKATAARPTRDRSRPGAKQHLEGLDQTPTAVDRLRAGVEAALEDGLTREEFEELKRRYDDLARAEQVEVEDALIKKGGNHRTLYSALKYGGYDHYQAASGTLIPASKPAEARPAGTHTAGSKIHTISAKRGANVANEIWDAVKDMDKELRRAAKMLIESIYGYMEGCATNGKQYAYSGPGLSDGEFAVIRMDLQHYRKGSPGDQVVYTRVYNWLVMGGVEGSRHRRSYQLLSQVVRSKGDKATHADYTGVGGAEEE